MRKHRIIDFSKEMKIHETGEGIIINSVPDALYVRSIDTLYFQKLETISPILKALKSCIGRPQRKKLRTSFQKSLSGLQAIMMRPRWEKPIDTGWLWQMIHSEV